MSAYEEITLGELARRMDALHTDVRELRSSIASHDDLKSAVDGWASALAAHESRARIELDTLDSRVGALEAWQTWAFRVVGGAVLVALLALVIVGEQSIG